MMEKGEVSAQKRFRAWFNGCRLRGRVGDQQWWVQERVEKWCRENVGKRGEGEGGWEDEDEVPEGEVEDWEDDEARIEREREFRRVVEGMYEEGRKKQKIKSEKEESE